ncbi:hypothetical protein FisN_17Lh300 [Fistulifera solaris]|uniref:Uncharacterized protein n=1 Tax=Fistulifera solaris TaxID=1519565 RepID=A0A1Z5J5G5_FISSO|nr:hypothetical protein FisN_17Lh300 [Fistulifera solaris]|eukprot:GAX09234.1 hypothetical protein FisN_17Lh300 [Fistulifera solaris]
MPTRKESVASEVVAAALAGALSATALHPLEVIKTNLVAKDDTCAEDKDERDDNTGNGMIATAQALYKEGGVARFFRGVQFSAVQSSIEKALYFFSYTCLKQVHSTFSGGAAMNTLTNLILGYAAEWSHLPITLPIDSITTAIQTSSKGDGAFQVLMTMLSSKNQKYYNAISAYYLLCLKPALQYTIYEQVKTVWLRSKSRRALTAVEAFALGMVARTVATILVFPFLRAKVLLQTQGSQQNNTIEGGVSKTTTMVLNEQWNRAGLAGLYQGLSPELTRGVLSAALMLMIKERIAEKVQHVFSTKS